LVRGFLAETEEWPEATIKMFVGMFEEICADNDDASVQLSYLDVVTKSVLSGAIKGDEVRRVIARVAEMARGKSIAVREGGGSRGGSTGVPVEITRVVARSRDAVAGYFPDLMEAVGPEERAALIFAGAWLDGNKTDEAMSTAAVEVAWLAEDSPRIGDVVQGLASSDSEFTRAALCNALALFHSDAIVKTVAEKLLEDPKSSVEICAFAALSRSVLSEAEVEWRAPIADACGSSRPMCEPASR
jgi:hypothetical protein